MSNNISGTRLTENQAQKYISTNDQQEEMDAFLTELVTVPITASNTFTLTLLQNTRAQHYSVTNSGATNACTLNLQSVKRGLFTVTNSIGFNLTVQISGQPGVPPVLNTGSSRLLRCDGVNVYNVTIDQPLDIAAQFGSTPGAGSVVFERVTSAETFKTPINFTGSQGYCRVAPSGSTAFTVKKNTTSLGTITFAGGSNTATFIAAAAISFNAGDRISIEAPGALNGIADLSFTLIANRTV
jgi:hypothetical protein